MRSRHLATISFALLACSAGQKSAPTGTNNGNGNDAGGNTGTPAPPATTVAVTPPSSLTLVGASVKLSVASGVTAPVWSVNGVAGGNAQVGTIDATGNYTAPGAVPATNPVQITVANSPDNGATGSATVAVTPAAFTGNWTVTEPRVFNTATAASLILIAKAPTGTTRIDFAPRNAGAVVPFTLVRDSLFQITLTAAQVLAGYTTGDLHNAIGFARYYSGASLTLTGNIVVNVRDGGVPGASVSALAADAQRTAHVLNIRNDALINGNVIPASVPKRFYALVTDDYDFLGVVEQVDTYANRNYQGVRSIEVGIGSSDPFDNSVQFGSAGKLQGMIDYPIASNFDLGQQAALHEIGHRWINYASHIAYVPGRPHWPLSDLGYGIMGISLVGGEGGNFNYTLTPLGNGDYSVASTTEAVAYNDYELYLMGLAPASEVIPHFVFQNQNQSDQIKNGGVLKGPVTTVTINDVVNFIGSPRVPAYGTAQTNFHYATIVLSSGRLLTADEMSYFDYMAARGEATAPLHYTSGLIGGTSWPFFLATKQRGTLTTVIK